MKITTLVPLQFNDGRSVSEEQLQQIIGSLVKQFGACTEDGRVTGHRPEPDRPGIAHEQMLKLSIEMARERLDEARTAVLQIGRQLAQREMYFEVREYDGVQIVKVG